MSNSLYACHFQVPLYTGTCPIKAVKMNHHVAYTSNILFTHFFRPFFVFFFYIYCIYLKNMSAEQADTTKKATGGEGMLPLCE